MYTDNYNESNETNDKNGSFVERFNEYKGNDKIKIIIIGVLAIVLIVMLVMIFKGGGSSSSGYVINVYPETIVVKPGGSQNVSYEVRKDGTIIPNAVVRLAIDNESVARVENTNVIGVNYGKAMLTITYVDDSGKSTQNVKEVTVSDGNEGTSVSNVTIPNGDLYMPLNGTYDIPITIEPSNAYIESKKITSSDNNVVLVDDTGKVTSISEGGAVITIDINNGQFKKQLRVYVSSDIEMPRIGSGDASITINSTSNTLGVGATSSLTYTVNPSSASVGTVTWTSSDPSVVSVDSNGTITGIKEGTAVITASTSSGVTGSITIQVGAAITDITLSSSYINLVVGQSETIIPTIVPDNASDKTLTYTPADSAIVSVISNADGSATITGLSVGSTTVTVQSSNGISKQVTVVVTADSGGSSGGDCASCKGKSCASGEYCKCGKCRKCEEGYRCSNSERIKCPSGSTSKAGSTYCTATECPAGQGAGDPSISICASCGKGYYSPDKDIKCYACPEGWTTTKNSGASSKSDCNICKDGYYKDGNNCKKNNPSSTLKPQSCGTGQYYNTAQAKCMDCVAPYYCKDSKIYSCPNGRKTTKNKATSENDCVNTMATTSPTATSKNCGTGQYYNTAQAKCMDCVAPYYCTNSKIYSCPNNGKTTKNKATSKNDCVYG